MVIVSEEACYTTAKGIDCVHGDLSISQEQRHNQ